TLDAGEHYSSMGQIDGTTDVALAIPINAGAKVATSKPISGMILTGGPNGFAARFYLLLPDVLHGTDYITTAPGDDSSIPTATGPADAPGTGGAVPNRP